MIELVKNSKTLNDIHESEIGGAFSVFKKTAIWKFLDRHNRDPAVYE